MFEEQAYGPSFFSFAAAQEGEGCMRCVLRLEMGIRVNGGAARVVEWPNVCMGVNECLKVAAKAHIYIEKVRHGWDLFRQSEFILNPKGKGN